MCAVDVSIVVEAEPSWHCNGDGMLLASKSDDNSAFRDHEPPTSVTVDTFIIRNVKSDDISAFRDDFRPSCMSDPPWTLANDCGRLRTFVSTNAENSRRFLDPWTPILKQEPFCGAFGKMSDTESELGTCPRRNI